MPAPSKPTNLTLVSNDRSIFLNWAAPTDNGGSQITDYVVQRRLASQTNASFVGIVPDPVNPNPRANAGGLLNGTPYVFRVAARNAIGLGTFSEISSAIAPTHIPATPKAPTCSLPAIATGGQVLVKWIAPSNNGLLISSYTIRRKAGLAGAWVQLTYSGVATQYVDTGLVNGVSYYYSVVAYNAKGFGGWSADSLAIVPRGVPSAPTINTATAFFAPPNIGNQVTLGWTAPAIPGGFGITDYVVQRRPANQTDASFGVVAEIPNTPSAALSTRIGGNQNGTAYVFRVAAKNAKGLGSWSSNSASVTTSIRPSRITAAPTGIKGNGQVTLSWIAPANNGSDITNYVIQINGQVKINTFSNSTTHTVTGLVNGTSYVFRVAAQNIRGLSFDNVTKLSYSPPSLPVIPSISRPSAPINLVATLSSGNQVNLNWNAPNNNGGATITSYVIQRRDGQQNYPQIGTTTSTNFSNQVNFGATYSFRVAAVNAAGQGDTSEVSIVVPAGIPSAPADLIATPFGTERLVKLSLTQPSNGGSTITSYNVQIRKTSESVFTNRILEVLETLPPPTNVGLSNLENNTTYILRVAAVNSFGEGPYSGTVQFTMPAGIPIAPTNLVATIVNDTEVRLTWSAPTNNGGSNITNYTVQFSGDLGPLYSWQTIQNYQQTGEIFAASYPQRNLDGFEDIPMIFRVSATNSAGSGPYSSSSNSVTPSNELFDKSSWRGVVAEPYFSYLNKAADRWYKYIKYNSTDRSTIVSQNSGWDGLRLEDGEYTFYTDSSSSTIASSGPIYAKPLGGKRYVSISFQLNINDHHRTKTNPLTENNWIDTITHELGHALGIGLYWNADVFTGATSPVDFFLDGTVYTLGQAAYNAITSQTRSKMPLENTGGGGTASAHWEDSFRPASAAGSLGVSYPGLSNELMVGYIVNNMVMSRLTLKTLVDFGYEEINPGTSEGNPGLVSSITTGFIEGEILGKCEGVKMDKVIIIGDDQENV